MVCTLLGSSPAPALGKPTITDLAAVIFEGIESLGPEEYDLYGIATGSSIAAELAMLDSDRVRRLILDNVTMFPEAERQEYVRSYAPSFRIERRSS